MITVSVVYPKTPASRFDHPYYANSHTPLLKRLFDPFGIGNVRLLKGQASLGGGAPSHEMICTFEMPSAESLHKALAQHGAEIMGDVKNYTDIQPVIQINESA